MTLEAVFLLILCFCVLAAGASVASSIGSLAEEVEKLHFEVKEIRTLLTPPAPPFSWPDDEPKLREDGSCANCGATPEQFGLCPLCEQFKKAA